jgi:hypothetical protein
MDGTGGKGLFLLFSAATPLLLYGPIVPTPPPAAVLIIPLSVMAALFIAVVASSKLRKRLHRGPHRKSGDTGLTVIEESGIIDMAVLYVSTVFFIYGAFLASAICAFGFGIGSIYFFDRVMSFVHKKRINYVSTTGMIRYIEELGVLESGVIVAAIYLFVKGEYLPSVLLSWVFGMLLAMMVDKARTRREIRSQK